MYWKVLKGGFNINKPERYIERFWKEGLILIKVEDVLKGFERKV